MLVKHSKTVGNPGKCPLYLLGAKTVGNPVSTWEALAWLCDLLPTYRPFLDGVGTWDIHWNQWLLEKKSPLVTGAFKMCMLCLFSLPSVKMENCYVMMSIGPYFLGCYVIGAFSMPILSLYMLWLVSLPFLLGKSPSSALLSIWCAPWHGVTHTFSRSSRSSLLRWSIWRTAPRRISALEPGWFPLDDLSMAGVN